MRTHCPALFVRLVLVASVVAGAGVLAGGGASAAPLEDGELATLAEGVDHAPPSPDGQAQIDAALAAVPPLLRQRSAEQLTATARAAAPTTIEDFRYDPLVTKGAAKDVCNGGLRPGTALTYQRLTSLFGGAPGTMYSCRERWATNENRNCDGQVINPVTQPNFTTDCWSNHAQGRALDIMVGQVGGGYNVTRGNNIVNWLLAPDADGNQNANARRLGVQQLLWNNRCWNSEGDRGVANASQMRVCGYGHYDHVHADLTLLGADGLTSYWGYAPQPAAPTMNSMGVLARGTGGYTAQRWTNLRNSVSLNGSITPGNTLSATGDWDGDGVLNDQLVYNSASGAYEVISWDGLVPTVRASARWATSWNRMAAGDFDSDGLQDELLVVNLQSGSWQIYEFTNFQARMRTSGTVPGTWTEVVVGDWDDDGRPDDTMFWNSATAKWRVDAWYRFTNKLRRTGTFSTTWDRIVPGDWDSQGEIDDMFLWDAQTGSTAIYSWGAVSLTQIVPGRTTVKWDQFYATDLDTDGRVDDLVAWDYHAGTMGVYSYRRSVPTEVARRTWSTRFDLFFVGVWG